MELPRFISRIRVLTQLATCQFILFFSW